MTVQADTNASAGYSNIPFTRAILAHPAVRSQKGLCAFGKFPGRSFRATLRALPDRAEGLLLHAARRFAPRSPQYASAGL